MKAYIIILTLVISSYVKGQDTALFKGVDSIVAAVDFAASIGTFDTLKSNMVNRAGTTSDIFVLAQSRSVQKIYAFTKATNNHCNMIFQSGKPVFLQMSQGGTPWNYYFVGENTCLYFKDDNRLITLSGKYYYDLIDDYLRLFKDQLNKDGN